MKTKHKLVIKILSHLIENDITTKEFCEMTHMSQTKWEQLRTNPDKITFFRLNIIEAALEIDLFRKCPLSSGDRIKFGGITHLVQDVHKTIGLNDKIVWIVSTNNSKIAINNINGIKLLRKGTSQSKKDPWMSMPDCYNIKKQDDEYPYYEKVGLAL